MGVVPNGSSGVTPGDWAISGTGTSGMKSRTQASVTSALKGDVATPGAGSIGNSWGNVLNFGGLLKGVSQKADTVSNEIIAISADQVAANERLTDLETIAGTGVVTPIWASAGGKDLVSFPRVLMQPIPKSPTVTADGGDGDGSIGGKGIHSHAITMIPPAFTQTNKIPDFAFLRGGLSAETKANVVKIITGADASFVDIGAWYLGAYVYNGSGMVKFWDSGNLKSVLSGQRQAYNIGTGLTSSAIQPDHLIAIASLQVVTGVAQAPRGIGCVFQTSIAEASGTVPSAPHATLLNPLTALPDWVDMTWFQWKRDKIMWAAIGESS